jgi:pyridoxal phosphate enzyme (YggS family)
MTRQEQGTGKSELLQQIVERAALLQARILNITDRSVKVVCVTKGHGVNVKAAAFAAGFTDLGENYAQELVAGAASLGAGAASLGAGAANLPTSPRWHFIGGLQSNKVRSLAEIVSLWQSVDRLSLAQEIARRAPGAQVLVQLDLAGISGRSGIAPADAAELVRNCIDLGLDVRGLMGVGVPGPPEESRLGFRMLSNLADELELPERSIGMSNDFEVAVSEGSTMLRVGSALLGPRTSPAAGSAR